MKSSDRKTVIFSVPYETVRRKGTH